MASNRRKVRLEGIVRGEDNEATCVVAATEVSLLGVPPAYCEFSVESVSKRLPPGRYEVTTNGQTNRLRFDGRYWLADV